MKKLTAEEVENVRISLKFQETVREYFGFLETEYSYKIVETGLYKIRYEKHGVYIEIWHECISFEFDVIIGIIGKKPKYLTLDRILANKQIPTRLYQGASTRNVIFCIEQLANELKTNAYDIIAYRKTDLENFISSLSV